MYSFGLSASTFAYLLQDNNNNLWQQSCTVNGNNYNCVLTANYSLSGPLAAVAMQKIIGNTITVVGLAIANDVSVQFYNYYNPSINFTASLGGYLTDIEIVGDYAIVAVSGIQVEIFYLSNSSATLITTIIAANAAQWTGAGPSDWTPMKLHTSSKVPNRVFVETNTGVYVIGFAFTEYQVYFFDFIVFGGNISEATTYSRSLQVFGNYLLAIEATSSNSKNIIEYNFANPYNYTITHSIKLPGLGPLFPVVASNSDTS